MHAFRARSPQPSFAAEVSTDSHLLMLPTRAFTSTGRTFRMVDLEAAVSGLGGSVVEMPYVMRVLAENVLRAHHARGPSAVSEAEIRNVVDWQNHIGEDLSL